MDKVRDESSIGSGNHHNMMYVKGFVVPLALKQRFLWCHGRATNNPRPSIVARWGWWLFMVSIFNRESLEALCKWTRRCLIFPSGADRIANAQGFYEKKHNTTFNGLYHRSWLRSPYTSGKNWDKLQENLEETWWKLNSVPSQVSVLKSPFLEFRSKFFHRSVRVSFVFKPRLSPCATFTSR